jgi:hypothetical protein
VRTGLIVAPDRQSAIALLSLLVPKTLCHLAGYSADRWMLGMLGGQVDVVPRCCLARSDGAVAPDCHHGHRSADPVPAQPYLPVSLADPVLAHRPSQFKPRRLQQLPKARLLQAGARHDLMLTTARQAEQGRGRRNVSELRPQNP